MLAEGWKEANIRMGLLGLGEGESQDPKQGNRTLSPEKGRAQTLPSRNPCPQNTGKQTLALSVSRKRSGQPRERGERILGEKVQKM